VTVLARDVAGNLGTATVSFLIDTTAPALEVPAAPETPPTVTPNGDGIGEQVALPFSVSEPGSVTVSVTDAAAKVVRTSTLPVAAGPGSATWDGRTATGTAVPDGRYTVTFRPTDAAGNRGQATTDAVDVYGALKGLARTPTLFFPQDGDSLARSATASWTLLSPATVTVRVLDARGNVVRSPIKAKALPAGAGSWTWSGKTDAGIWAPHGTYRVVVTATNGTQAATQTVTVIADAFRIATSTPTATRGRAITVTATSAEPLKTAPRVVVRQPGVADWTVPMTVSGGHWTATVTPRKTGTAGTMTLYVKATDTAGGANQSSVRVVLQ
jgi:flagellar hook assembly protein FlgD